MLDNVRFVLEDGSTLREWDTYSVNSDFLTPTDGWSVRMNGIDYNAQIQPDSKLQMWIDGQLQLTGIVDSISTTSDLSGGTTIEIQGRDILRPLCKANIRPDFRVKGLTLVQMVEQVCALYYRDPPTIFFDQAANREVMGIKAGYRPKDRKSSTQKVIDYCQAHPNEGAFEFVSRNLRRFGLWLWATADGSLVVGGPTYEQEPAYRITRRRGERTVAYEHSNYTVDHTSTPSFLEVRGKSTAKEWAKTPVRATVSNLDIEDRLFVEPVYIQHDQAETPEQAQAFALQEMTRLRQSERVYEVTAAGHRDRVTGNVFAVDCLAAIEDDFCNVRETMWVASRTFKGGMSGQTTELKLLPLYAVQIGDVDAP